MIFLRSAPRAIPVFLLLMAATLFPFVLYSQSLGFDYVYDDSELVIQRLIPEGPSSWLHRALSPYYIGMPYFRPLPALLFAAERTLFGLNPGLSHLTNLLAVSFLGAALFTLLSSPVFGLKGRTALLLAATICAHPVTSSVVYMLSGREALLSALFLTLTGLSLVTMRFGWMASLWLFLALCCRESSLFIVPYIASLTIRHLRTSDAPADGIRLICVVVLYLALRHTALSQSTTGPHLSNELILVPLSYLYAFSSILAPTIDLLYEPLLPQWLTETRIAAAAVAITALVTLIRRTQSIQTPSGAALAGLTLLSLLPTANIFEQETPFDERHLVPPLILLTITIGPAICHWVECFRSPRLRAVGALSLTIPVLAFTCISFQRGAVFSSDDVFFDHWIDQDPARPKVLNHIAVRAFGRGEAGEALATLNQSLDLRGNSIGFLYRGRIKRTNGAFDAARLDFHSALELDPELSTTWCDIWMNAMRAGKPDQARLALDHARLASTPPWCVREKGSTWESHVLWAGEKLLILPISTREELRNYREGENTQSASLTSSSAD